MSSACGGVNEDYGRMGRGCQGCLPGSQTRFMVAIDRTTVKVAFFAHLTSKPPAAARLALPVAPHIVADVNTLVVLDPLVADVTVIFS